MKIILLEYYLLNRTVRKRRNNKWSGKLYWAMIAGNFKMVDIEINAWCSLFLNIETNLNLYLHPEKCMKFNKSESRIRSREIWNFARHVRLIYKNGRDSLIWETGFWFFCTISKKEWIKHEIKSGYSDYAVGI